MFECLLCWCVQRYVNSLVGRVRIDPVMGRVIGTTSCASFFCEVSIAFLLWTVSFNESNIKLMGYLVK